MSVLQRLHDSEINAGVQSFFDGCWTAWIGDDMNGREAETTAPKSLAEAEAWLDAEARRLHPHSVYALGREAFEKHWYPDGRAPYPKPCGQPSGQSADGVSVWP